MDTRTSPPPAPTSFAALIARAQAGGPVRVAVADAAQEVVLDAMREAQRMGLATPHLVGDPDEIAPIMARLGWEAGTVELTASAPDADAAARAVALVHEGRADVVMKGNLHTDVFMRALLDSETGLRLPDRRVSHLFVLQIPDHDRLIGVTDAAINIAPDLAAKAQIAQNAIAAFQAIDLTEPRLAVLSAVETVTPAIASTLDAAALTLMARRGQITGARLGMRLANSIRSASFPKVGESLNAAVLVWSNAPVIVGAHDTGPLIRSKNGFWLAIPTPAAGKSTRGGRITPGEWERRTGLRLRLVFRRRGPSLLVAEGRLNTKGRAVASRSKTGRGLSTVPIFLLVPQVRLPKRLDLGRDAERVAGGLPGQIVTEWEKADR